MNAIEVFGYMPLEAAYDSYSVIKWTTAESMKELANKYFDMSNYVVAYLQPEK